MTRVALERQNKNDPRVEAVLTGSPQVLLLACVKCGNLLWDINKHYARFHPAGVSPLYGDSL